VLSRVLAEPPALAPDWLTAAYGRILLASGGPLLARGAGNAAWAERLAAARIEAVVEGADLDEARQHLWPLHAPLLRLDAGAGSCWPSVVLVGQAPGEWGPRRPWLSRSGRWLLRGVRAAGYDELTVYGANALDGRRRQGPRLAQLAEVLAPAAPAWVACGKVAAEVLRAAKVKAVEVEHPSWHRRFRYAEGEAGYATRLLGGGLPPGPWVGRVLPGEPVAAGGAPDLGGAFGGLPRTPSPARGGGDRKGGGGGAPGVDDVRATLARTLYVSGQATTLKAAADGAGAPYDPVRLLAREQGWDREREAHLEAQHRRVLDEVGRQEAGAIGAARRTVIASVVEGARQILDGLRARGEGRLELRPADLERLVRAFHVLADHREDSYPDATSLASAYAELRGALATELGSDGLAALDAEVGS